MLQAAPIFIVSKQATVRPQIAHGRLPTVVFTGAPYASLSFIEGMGVDMVGNVLGAALVNATEREAATTDAEEHWDWLQTGSCSGDADGPVRTALQGALQQAGANSPVNTGVLEDRKLEQLVSVDGGRVVVQHSTSFTPELMTVLTTVVVSAWLEGSGKTQKKPTWQNMLMVASAPLSLQAKTEQDSQVLLEAAETKYAQSGNEARILKVNAAGHGAHKADRQLAANTLRRHHRALRDAKDPDWAGNMESARRALFWSEGNCALLKQAVDDNALEAGRLVQSLLTNALPGEGQTVSAPSFAAVAEDQKPGLVYPRSAPRELEARTPQLHVSKLVGALVETGFFNSVLRVEGSSH